MNPRDWDILRILWNAREPLTSTEIVNAADAAIGLTQSTVIAVLRKLVKEKIVAVAGVSHCGKVLGRTYVATEESKVVALQELRSLYDCMSRVVTPEEVIQALGFSEQEGK